MSKGKKYNTPKRFWHKMRKKTKRPPYAKQRWRYTTAHVMGKKHNKLKWFYRKKKWFIDVLLKRMSFKFPTSHEIWGWD